MTSSRRVARSIGRARAGGSGERPPDPRHHERSIAGSGTGRVQPVMTARRWRLVSTRSIAVLLGVLMLATMEAWSAAPAHGRDLSGPITAVRAGQIAAEASMRSADKQLKTLKHRTKSVARRLRKARRRHEDALEQRAAARAQVRAARGQLATAHDALERQQDALVALASERDLRAVAGPAAASAALALDAVSASPQDDRWWSLDCRNPSARARPSPSSRARSPSSKGTWSAPELCPPDRAIARRWSARHGARRRERAQYGSKASSPASVPRSRSSTAPRRASPATSTR